MTLPEGAHAAGTVGYLRVRVVGHAQHFDGKPCEVLETIDATGTGTGVLSYEDPSMLVTAADAEAAVRRKMETEDV
ncbi:MAG: hypothetical protein RIB60_07550 [Phycisphaerales bacterium]